MNHILKFLLLIPLIIASDEILDVSEIYTVVMKNKELIYIKVHQIKF